MKVYGVSVSYYTGKLEAYLRYKGLAYTMTSPFAVAKELTPHVGAIQVPMVLRDDGRWMSDSTPIIAQLETEHPAGSVMPVEPVVRFIALLIEDYADEWLWRAAMHYRWSYEHDRALLSRILADEVATALRVPRFMKLRVVAKRQQTNFVINDGVTPETQPHVEQGYLNALANMTTMLEGSPYLFGDAPSIADFGMMGPMLRHFGQDPTPQEIMRNHGPAVYEWVARLWNAHATDSTSAFFTQVPDSCAPMLKELSETHLVQLQRNAEAFANGQRQFEMDVQGCHYRNLPVSRYRVYCLERLRELFAALPTEAKDSVRALLPFDAAEIIWTTTLPADSGHDPDREAPFCKGINVYE